MSKTVYEKGSIKFFLKEEITDHHQNAVAEITLKEPNREVALFGVRLAQLVRKAQMQAFATMKDLIDKDRKKESVGKEVEAFYKRELTDEDIKEVEEEANGLVELFISSDLDPEKLFTVFKGIVCRKLSDKMTLATVNCDDKDRNLTPETFDMMDINDQLHMIARYYSFFGFSSISASRNM